MFVSSSGGIQHNYMLTAVYVGNVLHKSATVNCAKLC